MRRIFWAFAVSAILHGVLLSWLWAEHPTRPFQTGVVYAHGISLAAPAPPLTAQRAEAVARPAHRLATPAQPSSTRKLEAVLPAHTLTPMPEPVAAPEPDGLSPTSTPPNDPVAETVTPSIGYLGPDEVDSPAEPVGDWVIDGRSIAPGQPLQWNIRVWISANGNVDGWELIGHSADDPIAQQALRELNLTVLNPARLDGKAVPSYRNLELSLGDR